MSRAVGIDLGTTNSVVSVMEGGDATVIANAEGFRTTPSVVAFDKSGNALVGEPAKNQAITNPERTISSIKREMGTNWNIDIDGKKYSPQEISARILMKLKKDAEAYLNAEVKEAVITVPAYFDDAQRTATKEAGQIAGLDVLRIVNEPTAAALAYGLDKSNSHETILVFDLGGGTFDVSLLSLGDGVLEVMATNGDTKLGGNDWDQAVIDWLIEKFKGDKGIDLSQDPSAVQRLKEASEKAKIELSQKPEAQINLPYVSATDTGPLHLDYTLTRSAFEEMTKELLDRCKHPFEQAIKDAGVDKSKIDHVILVGGSTRMPAVAELVKSLSGKEPHKGVNPDEVVATGATIQAGVLKGDVTDLLLLDVTPLTLGIETKGGIRTPLIERNTTIPTKRSETFTTAEGNQPSVEIHVLQGEREMAQYNKTLGKFMLDKLPPAPAGVPQIEVTFDIDANGIVNVSARDQATGNEQHITITGQSSLSDEEVEQMTKDATAHAEEDKKMREQAEVRNKAESVLNQTKRTLKDHDEQIPEDLKEKLNAKLSELEGLVGEAEIDTPRVDEAINELSNLSQEIGQHLYSEASTQEQNASNGFSGSENAEDSHDENQNEDENEDENIVEAEIVDGK